MSVEALIGAQSTTYGVQIAHNHSEGIIASPVAGPGPQNASLARWHAPFEKMSVFWTVVKDGAPPLLPSHRIYFQNGNRLFLGGERYGVIVPNVSGHTFHAAGRLDFQVMAPEGIDSEFDLAKCPWEQSSVKDFYLPRENFLDTGILNPNWIQPKGILPDPNIPFLNGLSG